MNDKLMEILVGVAIGFVLAAVILAPIARTRGAIAVSKGEIICHYNEFADDWDCIAVTK